MSGGTHGRGFAGREKEKGAEAPFSGNRSGAWGNAPCDFSYCALRRIRFMRAAGLETHRARSAAFWYEAFVMCGSEAPVAAGQAAARLLPARNASAAAVRPSAGSNN